jgi:hypothetical protein
MAPKECEKVLHFILHERARFKVCMVLPYEFYYHGPDRIEYIEESLPANLTRF